MATQFKNAVQKANAHPVRRVKTARNCDYGSESAKVKLLDVLIALGEVAKHPWIVLCDSLQENYLKPIPPLNPGWI